MRIGKKQVKKRFILFIAAVAVLFIVCILCVINAITKDKIEWGVLDENQFLDGLIIRDEYYYKFGSYGKIAYEKSEGDTVAKDQVIASTYSTDYIESKLEDLDNHRLSIAQYQQNIMNSIVDADLDQLSFDISVKEDEVKAATQNDNNVTALKLQLELDLLVSQKQALLKEKAKADEHLTTLYAQEDALEETIAQWKTDVKADRDGTISYSTDGFESRFCAKNISTLGAAEIKDAISKARSVKLSTDKAYRIVVNGKWYIILVSTTNPTIVLQNDYVLYQRGGQTQIKAKYVYGSKDGSSYICLFETENQLGEFINTRATQFSIGQSVEGMIVPSSSIKTVKGVKGIYVSNKGKKEFVYVKVVSSSGDKTIIQGLPGKAQPVVGQTIYK